MSKYQHTTFRSQGISRLLRGLIVIFVAVTLIVFSGVQIYHHSLGAVSGDQRTKIVTIESGSGVRQIARQLADEHVIRNAWALQLYSFSQHSGSKFKAGSYALSPSSSTPQIVATLTKGRVATRLVTILPGRRIDQVRADFINDGFSPSAVDKALQPDQYADLPILAFKPATATTLEGLLWPDSYQKDASTDPTTIVRQALTEMGQRLTPQLQADLAAHGLSPYEGLILASIIEQEVSKPSDRAQAAQVFISRYKAGIMLGSDVTANYGAIVAGRKPDLTFDSPYNTLLHSGLPPSPISSVSAGSLEAATHPASTDWLFFVAGDDGITYFSRTLAEHEALTDKHCHTLCGR